MIEFPVLNKRANRGNGHIKMEDMCIIVFTQDPRRLGFWLFSVHQSCCILSSMLVVSMSLWRSQVRLGHPLFPLKQHHPDFNPF